MREVPPTAGLPVQFGDLLSWPRADALASRLSALFELPQPAITCSGTMALAVALRALARESDRREVVVPA